MKKTLIILLIIQSVVSNSQQGPYGYYRDALIFGQNNSLYGSTARIQGVGGAAVALGGDLSSITANPAGLGFSEFKCARALASDGHCMLYL